MVFVVGEKERMLWAVGTMLNLDAANPQTLKAFPSQRLLNHKSWNPPQSAETLWPSEEEDDHIFLELSPLLYLGVGLQPASEGLG